jgi:hypothetical protein
MKYTFTKVFGIAITAGLMLTSCNLKPVDLKLNLEQGKTYTYTMTTTQHTEQVLMGETMKMDQTMIFGYSMDVKEVDADKNQTIHVKYDRIKMEQNSDNLSVVFDSQQPETADTGMAVMLAKPFRALLGNGFTMIIQPDGTVKSVTGIESMVNAIVARMSEGADLEAEVMEDIRMQISEQFNEEMLKANMEQGFRFYPDKPIKKGESWNVVQTMKSGLPMIIDTKYTLSKISGNTAYVNVDAKISADTTEQHFMGQITMDGKQTGKLEINIPTGLTTKGNLKQDINMKMTAMGMEMPAKLTSEIVIEGKAK